MTALHTLRDQRILIIAPHPDDEALATGGLIQRAIREGSGVRVIFVSSGENNPWPQRVVERRWRIGAKEKERWGLRRRQEALAALARLGAAPECAHFLGLPDQGMTDLLLRGDRMCVRMLESVLMDWTPTLVVAPSEHDLHPDHNALAVLLGIASMSGAGSPRQLRYIVHRGRAWLPRPSWTLHLTEQERRIKCESIAEHRTQMVLSAKRFKAYARTSEHYYEAGLKNPFHRIRHASIEHGALCVGIQKTRSLQEYGELIIAIESSALGSVRWRLTIQDWSGVARVKDAVTGRPLRNASVRCSDDGICLRIPIAVALPVERVAIKVKRRTMFYDDSGWFEVDLGNPAFADSRDEPRRSPLQALARLG